MGVYLGKLRELQTSTEHNHYNPVSNNHWLKILSVTAWQLTNRTVSDIFMQLDPDAV